MRLDLKGGGAKDSKKICKIEGFRIEAGFVRVAVSKNANINIDNLAPV